MCSSRIVFDSTANRCELPYHNKPVLLLNCEFNIFAVYLVSKTNPDINGGFFVNSREDADAIGIYELCL